MPLATFFFLCHVLREPNRSKLVLLCERAVCAVAGRAESCCCATTPVGGECIGAVSAVPQRRGRLLWTLQDPGGCCSGWTCCPLAPEPAISAIFLPSATRRRPVSHTCAHAVMHADALTRSNAHRYTCTREGTHAHKDTQMRASKRNGSG